MRLISDNKVVLSKPCIVFKKPLVPSVINVAVLVFINIGIFHVYIKTNMPHYIFIILEIPVLAFVFIFFVILAKTFSNANWLVKADCEKIFINIRSCLNTDLPPEDRIIEFELNEIKWVRPTYIGRQNYLDICIDMLSEEIENAVIKERIEPDPKIRTRCNDYPVSILNKRLLRIEFIQARPSIGEALEFLGEKGISIENIRYE